MGKRLKSIHDAIASLDSYGQKPEFKVTQKVKTLKSVFGTVMTLGVIITSIVYASNKFAHLYGRMDTMYAQYIAPNDISIDQVTNMTVGEVVNGYNLNVAWGMFNNSYLTPPDWKKIGKWAAYMEVWSSFPNGTQNMYYIPLNYHQCTADDLNYFYPIRREVPQMTALFLQMFCLDINQTVSFQGDWDAQKAIMLMIDLQECFGPGCYDVETKKAQFELYFSYTFYNT